MNLIEYRKQGYTLKRIKDCINSNLYGSRYWYRFDNVARHSPDQLATRKKAYRDFGLEFNKVAIKDQSIRQTISLINHNRHICINDCTELLYNLFNEEFYFCDDCDTLDLRDDTYWIEREDRRVCSDCEGNYDQDEEDQDYQFIGGRHSSKRLLGHIPSSYDNRKPRVLLGLELELEVNNNYDLDSKAESILDRIGTYYNSEGNSFRYALIEEDCSIDRGFEIVTAYTGIDVHKKQLKLFKDQVSGCKSHNTDTCGLHIHICKSTMTMLHASKLILFINDPENDPLVYALARRRDNGYCKKKDIENKDWITRALEYQDRSNQLCSLNWDRYEALNFQNEKTIEFRLFRGSLKFLTIMACLEFTYASWHFTQSASANELKTEHFLNWICKPENRSDTKHLRIYLKNKGFTLSFENKPDLRKAA